MRSLAVTHGQIADVLFRRGQLDEALAIRREKELPVYEKLGNMQAQVVCRTKIALTLRRRGRAEDVEEAREHLMWAWRAATERGLSEAGQIAEILRSLLPEALP